MTELKIEQRHRMLIEAIINDYHTTRLGGDYVSHILSKPRTQNAFLRFEQSLRPTAPDALRSAVERCRDVFAEYAELHRRKLPGCVTSAEHKAIITKVERNRDMADMCIAALGDE